jgi:hypothetical protein
MQFKLLFSSSLSAQRRYDLLQNLRKSWTDELRKIGHDSECDYCRMALHLLDSFSDFTFEFTYNNTEQSQHDALLARMDAGLQIIDNNSDVADNAEEETDHGNNIYYGNGYHYIPYTLPNLLFLDLIYNVLSETESESQPEPQLSPVKVKMNLPDLTPLQLFQLFSALIKVLRATCLSANHKVAIWQGYQDIFTTYMKNKSWLYESKDGYNVTMEVFLTTMGPIMLEAVSDTDWSNVKHHRAALRKIHKTLDEIIFLVDLEQGHGERDKKDANAKVMYDLTGNVWSLERKGGIYKRLVTWYEQRQEQYDKDEDEDEDARGDNSDHQNAAESSDDDCKVVEKNEDNEEPSSSGSKKRKNRSFDQEHPSPSNAKKIKTVITTKNK